MADVGDGSSIVNTNGVGSAKVPITRYLDRHLLHQAAAPADVRYLFDRTLTDELRGLLTANGELQLYEAAHEIYLAAGPNASGVGFHRHPDAVTTVTSGSKRWYFYPPDRPPPGVYGEHRSQHGWLDEVGRGLPEGDRPLRCVQPAHSTMYIPEMWWHQTVNLAAEGTIAVSAQEGWDSAVTAAARHDRAWRRASCSSEVRRHSLDPSCTDPRDPSMTVCARVYVQ